MTPWSCHSRELTSAAGKIKLHTQCDEMQHNETPHLIKNSTKATFQTSLTLADFIVFGKLYPHFQMDVCSRSSRKFGMASCLPHGYLAMLCNRISQQQSPKVWRRVLCRCRISPDPTVFHWPSLPAVPVYYCQRLTMRGRFINRAMRTDELMNQDIMHYPAP